MARKKKKTTKRADGRGYWPAGKPRHPVPPKRLINRLRKANGNLVGSPTSYRQIAWDLGVALTQPGRWARGEDHPHPDLVPKIDQVLRYYGL